MTQARGEFDKCDICGRWRGDHKLPELSLPGSSGKIAVLLCPDFIIDNGFYTTFRPKAEPEDASPPTLSAVKRAELERLQSGFKRLADHYYAQYHRNPSPAVRETLRRVTGDIDEMMQGKGRRQRRWSK
jgi:hypothetical protein